MRTLKAKKNKITTLILSIKDVVRWLCSKIPKSTRLQSNPRSKVTGFGMIETVVAIGILTIGMSAAVSLASRGLVASIVARDEITAFYLGIEAVETVRNERDNSVLRGDSWLEGIDASCFQTRGCMVKGNGVTRELVACSLTNGCDNLLYNEANHTYNIDIGESTKFRRSIHVTESVLDRELRVEVEMEWRTGPFVHPPIKIEATLMNWSG